MCNIVVCLSFISFITDVIFWGSFFFPENFPIFTGINVKEINVYF